MALDMDIDLIGSQPSLYKLYTQLAFVFARLDSQPQSIITDILTRGLERLAQHFPWTAGQVVNVNPDATATPLYKIRPLYRIPSRYCFKLACTTKVLVDLLQLQCVRARGTQRRSNTQPAR